jgi:RHH-type proline utilization regulon transcriptional repressor/proline dehydrogenase/delta 1-pyrroline-5-carboxylate dehydrogenase
MHVIGDPGAIETAVGPVINAQARDEIDAHITKAKKDGRLLHQVSQE